MSILDNPSLYEAWGQKDHVDLFGGWNNLPTSKLLRECYQFNEFQMFRSITGDQGCQSLSDIGCATGGFYRFFRKEWPALEYKGFDISDVAINRARQLYPEGQFNLFDGQLKLQDDLGSDIVFSRDVVHHQTEPNRFLSDLYNATRRYLVLRIRTREIGATVFDTEQSCQYTYGRWVPYIVYNTQEFIDLINSFHPSPARIILWRHPCVLGGHNSRFVPKALYYPETDTAETGVLIEKGSDNGGFNTNISNISVETHPEDHSPTRLVGLLKNMARRINH